MTRKEFEEYVFDTYNVRADYPFEDDLLTAVFRHEENRKWFALAMRISESKLGRKGNVKIDVVNLKCETDAILSMLDSEPGVYKAYHMNKAHWITLALDECSADILFYLLQASYDLTRTKCRKIKSKTHQRTENFINNIFL